MNRAWEHAAPPGVAPYLLKRRPIVRFDAALPQGDLAAVPAIAAAAEEIGFDCLWSSEIRHDPYLPLAFAAGATTRLQVGTAIALAFTRSPTVTAHTAWDLARLSHGRFILGLGTQVKAHVERRFSSEWSPPVERLCDYIGAVRAVWRSWQTGERLRYESSSYNLKLMTPFFNPGPLEHPEVPIFIAGVNRGLCVLAGELCQGFHVHPFHTPRYLREAVLPWLEEGLGRAGRDREELQVTSTMFVVTGRTEEERARNREEVRRQIAFYASTPSYRPVMELHGWADRAAQLTPLSLRGKWQEMADLITDEMVEQFAVEGETLGEAATLLHERYAGLLDRAAFYLPFVPGARDDEWRAAARSFELTVGGTDTDSRLPAPGP